MRTRAAVEFQRPTLVQVKKSLPARRRHLFLRLMPYNFSAGEDYAQLQALVHHCLANPSADLRVAALEELESLFDTGLAEIPSRDKLRIEVASIVRRQHFSCLASELELVARLDELDILISERKLHGSIVGVPELVGQVHWHKGRISAGRGDALLPLEEAVAVLTVTPPDELAGMSERERKSGIRLIRLYCMYGPPADGADPAVSRHLFFKQLGLPAWRALASSGFSEEDSDAGLYGETAMRRIEAALTEAIKQPSAEDDGRFSRIVKKSKLALVPTPDSAPVEPQATAEGSAMHTFISGTIPRTKGADDEDLSQYKVLCQPMPVARLPSASVLDQSLQQLKDEFPWAHTPLHRIFDDLKARALFGGVRLGFAPILLNGPGGCGKSRLAQRLADVLGVERFSMSLAGATDSMSILGTARGWSTGQPSPLLRPLLKGRASVMVCVDELDKARDKTDNSPPVTSALLSLLEPNEAKHWRDQYLQVELDLTPLLWVFTSNLAINLPAPLRSRLRILEIEQPTRAQMVHVIPFVIRDIEVEWGLPAGALNGVKVAPASLRYVSSMRGLRRVVTIAARTWMNGLNSTRH